MQEAPTKAIVTIIETAVENKNFVIRVLFIPKGAIPIIQIRLPSSDICGNTKRVVKVARFNAQAPRFK